MTRSNDAPVSKAASGKNSLTMQIYDGLLEKFLSNELAPGTIIDRRALAEEYHVSIAPVRDALQRLELEGFIETKSRSATVVKAITREDIFGMLAVREALEAQAARMVCGEVVRNNLDKLTRAAEQVDGCADIMDYWKADIQFHKEFISLCGCRLLINMYSQTMNVGNFYQINSFFMNRDPTKRDNHVALVQSLTNGDPDFAEAAIRRHLQSGKTDALLQI